MARKPVDLAAALGRAYNDLKALDGKARPVSKKACPLHLVREHQTGDGRKVIECAEEALPRKVNVGGMTVHITSTGKVQYPPALKGGRVGDMHQLARELHQLEDLKLDAIPRYQTFAGPKQAVNGLMKHNPALREGWTRYWASPLDDAFARWIDGGMRGPRPTPALVFPNFNNPTSGLPNTDFLDASADRPGRRYKLYGFLEKLYASVPPSRKWVDWLPVLKDLQDAYNAEVANDSTGGESYVEPWHEIVIPGRAGRELSRLNMQNPNLPTPDDLYEGFRRPKAKALTAASPADDDEPVPF